MTISNGWFFWALLSAVFAAFTAIFAKVGIRGVDSDLATLVRTAIILVVLSGFVWFTGKWTNPLELSSKTWLFLGLCNFEATSDLERNIVWNKDCSECVHELNLRRKRACFPDGIRVGWIASLGVLFMVGPGTPGTCPGRGSISH